MIVRTASRAVFECRDRSCAPPPVGTGGSRPSGGGGGRKTKRTAEMEKIARHQLKRNGFTHEETEKVLGGGGTNGLKGIARNILSRNGFTKGEVSALVARDKAEPSKPRPYERPFKAGAWERITDEDELVRHLMSTSLSKEILDNEPMRRFMEDEFVKEVRQRIKKGTHTYVNGSVTVLIDEFLDGTINKKALKLTQKRIEGLMEKFKLPVGSVSVTVTRDIIAGIPSALGAARMVQEGDSLALIWLDEDTMASDRKISSMNDPNQWQSGDKSVLMGDHAVAHEWGHILDTKRTEPERDALFERWSSGTSSGVGLSNYGRQSSAEAYAESFADWYMSGGKTVNPATLAYRDHYGWEVP